MLRAKPGGTDMQRIGAILLIAGLCAVAQPVSAEQDSAGLRPSARRQALPVAGAVVNPDWISKPSGEDVGRFYPAIAQALFIPGHATLHCRVNSLGAVQDCTVVSETPSGLGFGQAAVSLSSLFRMKPKTVDGQAVDGAEITVPINFSLPLWAPAPDPLESGPQPSAKAMDLARRLSVAMGDGQAILQYFTSQLDRLRQTEFAASSGAGAANQEVALQSLSDAMDARHGSFLDLKAKAIAQQMPENEMAQVLAFLETPAGKHWISTTQAITASVQAGDGNLTFAVMADARERFCKKVPCLPTKAVSVTAADQGAKP